MRLHCISLEQHCALLVQSSPTFPALWTKQGGGDGSTGVASKHAYALHLHSHKRNTCLPVACASGAFTHHFHGPVPNGSQPSNGPWPGGWDPDVDCKIIFHMQNV